MPFGDDDASEFTLTMRQERCALCPLQFVCVGGVWGPSEFACTCGVVEAMGIRVECNQSSAPRPKSTYGSLVSESMAGGCVHRRRLGPGETVKPIDYEGITIKEIR